MEQEITLERCPFCRGQRLMHLRGEVGNLHWTYCPTCRAEGPAGSSWEEAKELWNNRVTGWNTVEDEELKELPHLPEHGKKVIAFYNNKSYGRSRMIMAMYLQGYTEECNCEDECNCQYSEAKDQYFYPEGWYEVVDNWPDWSFITVSEGSISHWMYLPNKPC